MGETISSLVFRPPPPTPIKQNKFFYIQVPKQADVDYACSTRCGEMAPEMDFFPNSKQFRKFQERYRKNLNTKMNVLDDDGIGSNDKGNGNGGGSDSGNVYGSDNCKEQNHHRGERDIKHSSNDNDNGVISSISLQSSSSSSIEEYKIPAFFLRRKGAQVTILFSHGNAEDLGMMYRRMKEMAMSFCANVLAYDYTGYGLSTSPSSSTAAQRQPSEEMCYRNIEAAYKHLTETMKIPPSQIILYGRSLGSGPSCYLAKKTADDGESVAGLILHSPFLSIYRIVIDCRVNLVGDMFINKSKAPHIRCPVLIIHGTKDDVVPFWHGDELLRSFPPEYRAQPFWVNGLGHNHIEVKRKDEYVKRILNFIEMYVISQQNNTKEKFTSIQQRSSYPRNRGRVPAVIPEPEQYKPENSLKESGKFLVNQTWMKHGLEIVSEAIQDKKDKLKKKTIGSDKNNKIHCGKILPNENGRTDDQIRIRKNEPQSPLLLPPPPPSHSPKLPTKETFQQQIEKLSSDSCNDYYQETKHQNVIKSVNFLKRMNTNDLMIKAKEAENENKSAIRAMREMDTSSFTSQGSSYSIESAASRYLLTKESWGTDDEEEDVSFDDDVKENIVGNRGVSLQTFTQGNLSGFSLQSSFNHNACELSLCKDIKDNEINSIDGARCPKKKNTEYRTSNFPIDRYSPHVGGF